MEITRNGTRPSVKGPAEHFTGSVRVDPLFQASAPARAGGAFVTFEPCARSDWHTHPLGQTLIVTLGCGRHQRWGEAVEEIRPGDVVSVGPNERQRNSRSWARIERVDRHPNSSHQRSRTRWSCFRSPVPVGGASDA